MSCCLSAKSPTALELYAKSLLKDTGVPMLFPMYTVSVDLLLKMTKVEPHEDLKANGSLTIFDDSTSGKAALVSHQWVGQGHPDPGFRQMSVLQDCLRLLLSGSGQVSADLVTEVYVPNAKPIPFKDFQSALYIWYDYFSIPQKEERSAYASDQSDGSNQGKAINSIPAYVHRCTFFMALCPVVDSHSKVFSTTTWAQRGWCRVEKAARELSQHSTWILIQGSGAMEVMGTIMAFPTGPVGEGDFTMEEDRMKLAPVMRNIVLQKLRHCLRSGDFAGFRLHLNLQSVHLRGLEIEPVEGVLPDIHAEGDAPDAVVRFLHQNGFRYSTRPDRAGLRPLHYAALSGNSMVIKGLLQQRASVNGRTSKDQPSLGFPKGVSALDLAIYYKHNDAAKLLIEQKAQLVGGILSTVALAAVSDNAEGIRLICAAGGDPRLLDLVGTLPYQSATAYLALAAFEELVAQAPPSSGDLGAALWGAAAGRGGSAEMVERLLGLRADVNFQYDVGNMSRIGQLVVAVNGARYRFGTITSLTGLTYHQHGTTPLMQAIRSGQYEAAAALIAAGAKLEIQNHRGWTAADFGKHTSLPHFLQQGLAGDQSECKRVSALALKDGLIQVAF
ncbi:anks1b [Symbiodinium sp. CCMP2592]|nr:anks1b [Symbiodinium sp. CCMP2592]